MKNTNKNTNINKNHVTVKIVKGSSGGGSKKLPPDCKPRTKCGNTGMMPPNMYELRHMACTNRKCPLCIL